MKQYLIKPVTTGFFSGSLSEKKLQDFLNQHGTQGWKFVKSIHEKEKVLLFFSREAHFVIFERDGAGDDPPVSGTEETNYLLRAVIQQMADDPTPHLLRQLLRSYKIEPEV